MRIGSFGEVRRRGRVYGPLPIIGGGGSAIIKPQDVFATSPYTGNGGTRSVVNGLDLATKGGLTWIKNRAASSDHVLTDTVRGANKLLFTNSTAVEDPGDYGVSSFNTDGFTTSGAGSYNNGGGVNYASWSFCRAAKFFDEVTYTGDGTTGRQIPHGLGIAPGVIKAKARSATSAWAVRHRSASGNLYLNTTAAQTGSFTDITASDATTFTVNASFNASGITYVAYLFAHDPDTTNGIVQCGSVTTTTGGAFTINTGWPIQWVLTRRSDSTDSWYILDTTRGFGAGNDAVLIANSSGAEQSFDAGASTSTGASFTAGGLETGSGGNMIYLAIRAAY